MFLLRLVPKEKNLCTLSSLSANGGEKNKKICMYKKICMCSLQMKLKGEIPMKKKMYLKFT